MFDNVRNGRILVPIMKHSSGQNSPDSETKLSTDPSATTSSRKNAGGIRKIRGKAKPVSRDGPLFKKLDALKQLLLTQGYLSELPSEFAGDTLPDGFIDVFQREEPFRDPDDSIQYALFDVLSKTGNCDFAQKYRDAKKSTIEPLFAATINIYFEHKSLASKTVAQALHRTLFLEDPDSMLTNPLVLEYLFDQISKDRSRFLKSLGLDCYNVDRRSQRVPMDVCSYILARHWTNKHCPLWLMQRVAIVDACKSLAPNESWSEAIVRERIRKHKLVRYQPSPIAKVQLNENKEISGITVESTIFQKLNSKEFGFYFLPPPTGCPEELYIPGLRCESDTLNIHSASYQAEIKEASFAGAPRGVMQIEDRGVALRRQAESIMARLTSLKLPYDDPRWKNGMAKVEAINKVLMVLGAVSSRLRFKAGWREPYLGARYRASESGYKSNRGFAIS